MFEFKTEKISIFRLAQKGDTAVSAVEDLKFYMTQGKAKVDLIMEHATKLRVAKTMLPYLEAFLGTTVCAGFKAYLAWPSAQGLIRDLCSRRVIPLPAVARRQAEAFDLRSQSLPNL
jgi:hypothetical protein